MNHHFSTEVRGAERWSDRPWHRLLWSLAVPCWDALASSDWKLRCITERLAQEFDTVARDRVLDNLAAVVGHPVMASGLFSPGMPIVLLADHHNHGYPCGEVVQVADRVRGSWRAFSQDRRFNGIPLGKPLPGVGPDSSQVRIATEAEFIVHLENLPATDAMKCVRRLALSLELRGDTWDYDPLAEPPLPPEADAPIVLGSRSEDDQIDPILSDSFAQDSADNSSVTPASDPDNITF